MEFLQSTLGDGKSLYEMIEVGRKATSEEIKKAYFKLALKWHPDKCPGDETAKARFQALGVVHSILSDAEKRKIYDDSGDIGEDNERSKFSFDEWYNYYRELFPKVTTDDIDKFKGEYQGSEEEGKAIIEAYERCKGNIGKVIDSVMLLSEDDVERVQSVIDKAIEEGETKSYANYKKSVSMLKNKIKKKSKKSQREAKEAEQLAELLKEKSLERHINKRGADFNQMVASLEAKCTAERSGKRRRKLPEEPQIDDEEFARIQEKMLKNRSKTKKAKSLAK